MDALNELNEPNVLCSNVLILIVLNVLNVLIVLNALCSMCSSVECVGCNAMIVWKWNVNVESKQLKQISVTGSPSTRYPNSCRPCSV